jgi:hypothetical protein
MNGPVDLVTCDETPRSPTAPVTVVVAMPSAVPATVSSPSHLCRIRPNILLNRCGRTGIAERQRLRAIARSGKGEQCANGSKAQNFRHLHI